MTNTIYYKFFDKTCRTTTGRYNDKLLQEPNLAQEIASNRRAILKELRGTNLMTLRQVHGNTVIEVKCNSNFDQLHEGDALITNEPGIILGIQTADCVPLLFYSEDKEVIGAIHAGWKSAFLDIINQAIYKMKMLGGQKIQAIIGPCIHQHSYEVDQEFFEKFIEENSYNQQFFIPAKREKHFFFSLKDYVKNKLSLAGVANIKDINEDTYTQPDRYFSFRRDTHQKKKDNRRMLSAIVKHI